MQKITYTNKYGQSISFGEDAPYFLISFDGSSVGTSADTYKPIGKDGQNTRDIRLNPRALIATLGIIGIKDARYSEKTMREIWKNVGKIMLPNSNGTLIYENDGGKYRITCRLTSIPNMERVLNSYGKFKIEFIADNPYWETTTEFRSVLGQVEKKAHFPIVWPRMYGVFQTTATIDNDTNLLMPIKITLQTTASYVKIINTTTGEFVQVDKALLSSQRMIIDTAECSVVIQTLDESGEVTSSENANYRLTVDSTPDMMLTVGENILEIENGVSGSVVPATVTYHKRCIVV